MASARHFMHLFDHADNVETHPAGTVLYNAGEPGRTMYVIREGRVEIRYKGHPIATLERGDIFGEMALIDNHVRLASAVALTDAALVPIDQKRFHFMIATTPHFATEVMAVLAERIRLLLESAYKE
jgi:CRP-like cAMP-binding protein